MSVTSHTPRAALFLSAAIAALLASARAEPACVPIAMAAGDLDAGASAGRAGDARVGAPVAATGAPLGAAIDALARAEGLDVAYAPADVAGHRAGPVAGACAGEAALDALLAGSGLVRTKTAGGVNVLRPARYAAAQGDPVAGPGADDEADRAAPARNEQTAPPADSVEERDRRAPDARASARRGPIDEVVVTGTNLRGVGEGASPVIVLDRFEIDRTGYATAQEVLRALPQNFGAGASDIPLGAGTRSDDALGNVGYGAGVNLRGLGNDSTLVLLNGRRMPAGGLNGAFADISMIPLTAVDRIEVMADGASAIYGSDAIAGVVNFVLREDFDGAQTRLRAGTVTDGGLQEYRASQLLGTTWRSGRILAAYEFHRRSALASAARPYAASNDLRPFGGTDFRRTGGNPGTITDIPTGRTAAIPEGQDGTDLEPGDFVIGTRNLQDLREGTDVLPLQARHSAFATATQEIANGVELFAEGAYSTRAYALRIQPIIEQVIVTPASPFFVDPFGGASILRVSYTSREDFGQPVSSGRAESFTAVAGARAALGPWTLEAFAGAARDGADRRTQNGAANSAALFAAANNPDPAAAFNPFGDGSNTPAAVLASVRQDEAGTGVSAETRSLDLRADGPVLDAPGGALRLAVGAHARREVLDAENLATGAAIFDGLERSVVAGFGEILAPLVGEANARPLLARLDITAAGRVEHYDDIGMAATPKAGLVYAPAEDLILRAAYGRSFKAPLLVELEDTNPSFNGAFFEFGGGAFTPVNTLYITGRNSELKPEKAETFTLGFAATPRFAEGLSLEATYFGVRYTDRISSTARPVPEYLANLDVYGELLTFDPSLDAVRAIVDAPTYLNRFGEQADLISGATPVELIIDRRLKNVAATRINGVDFDVRYSRDLLGGAARASLSGSYLLDFEEAFIATAPLLERVDTTGFPIDLRMRGGAGWSTPRFSLDFAVNYAGAYRDVVSVPARRVEAWTTIDAQMRYAFGAGAGRDGAGLALAVSVQNLFDADPPFLNSANGVGFDERNANALGRFVAIELSKSW